MIQGIKIKDIRDFENACRNLNDIIERITTYKPEARIFVADGSIHLMGEFLCAREASQNEQERIVASVNVSNMDCGSW